MIKFSSALLFSLLLTLLAVRGQDFAMLCADREAIERVCYEHRAGEKPPFDEVLPPATLENLVRQNLRKEAVLRQTYGVEITPAKLAAEAQRLTTNACSPELLAEIKAALGNDPVRFASSVARPSLVERRLHEIFDNDDELHAPVRRSAERMRQELQAARTNAADFGALLALFQHRHSNAVTEITWQLTPRPEAANPPAGAGRGLKFYFADLPGDLQNDLRAQLRQTGDVSTVIERSGGFLLFVAKTNTAATLSVLRLNLPKCGYEQWIEEQIESQP